MYFSEQRRPTSLAVGHGHGDANLHPDVLLDAVCFPVDRQRHGDGSNTMRIAAPFGISKGLICRREEGTAAVEAALVFPVLFLLILGIIEFGTAFWQWNTMLRAVERAGRYVMVNNASCDAICAETQMQTVLSSAAICTTPTAGQICVSAASGTTCGSPSMTLTANYSFNFFGLAGPFTITSQNCVPLD
jgi:Flp pilus assembly protein TadG